MCCRPPGHPELDRLFSLDLEERVASPSRDFPETFEEGFATAVAEGLDEESYRLLLESLEERKRALVETMTVEYDRVEPPAELIDAGHTVAFEAMFPFARRLRPRAEGEDEDMLAIDQYCLAPRCRCREVVLTFSVLTSPPEAAEPSCRDVANVVLNPFTGKWRCDPGEPLPLCRRLMARLRENEPDLDEVLQRRRILTRGLAECSRARRALRASASPSTEMEDAPPATVRVPAKVGRNEPCPCGSGRKFKRCCGR
jgi:hypothetical protein